MKKSSDYRAAFLICLCLITVSFACSSCCCCGGSGSSDTPSYSGSGSSETAKDVWQKEGTPEAIRAKGVDENGKPVFECTSSSGRTYELKKESKDGPYVETKN